MSTPNNMPRRKRSPASFVASVPERAVRATAATVGGAVYQTTEVLLPRWFRRSKLYQATVARVLRITVELVGGVRGVMPADRLSAGELAVRKAAGNVVEFASILAVGLSPLWLLAAASDITGGTKVYLRTLVAELQRDGLLPPDANIASFEDLLDRVAKTSGLLADTIDVPPVDVKEARASWETLRKNVTGLPNPETMADVFAQLQTAAARDGRSLLEVSSLIALGAVRAGVQLGNTYIFQYYQEALGAILTEGVAAYAQRIATPYLSAAGRHLNPGTRSYTQRLLRRAGQLWRRLRSRPAAS